MPAPIVWTPELILQLRELANQKPAPTNEALAQILGFGSNTIRLARKRFGCATSRRVLERVTVVGRTKPTRAVSKETKERQMLVATTVAKHTMPVGQGMAIVDAHYAQSGEPVVWFGSHAEWLGMQALLNTGAQQ